MPIPTHLIAGDYTKSFPVAVDEFPAPVNEEHYIDAWIINSAFDSALAIEQYLLDHKANIEAAAGSDIIGEDGQLLISIPPALYPPYKSALAWDSDLLEENIISGVNIFGVAGTLNVSGGAGAISAPSFLLLDLTFTPVTPPGLDVTASVPTIAVPGVTTP